MQAPKHKPIITLTIAGYMLCTVPEFNPQTYNGLRSGIGGERKSSKHYRCKEKCCATTKVWKHRKV